MIIKNLGRICIVLDDLWSTSWLEGGRRVPQNNSEQGVRNLTGIFTSWTLSKRLIDLPLTFILRQNSVTFKKTDFILFLWFRVALWIQLLRILNLDFLHLFITIPKDASRTEQHSSSWPFIWLMANQTLFDELKIEFKNKSNLREEKTHTKIIQPVDLCCYLIFVFV